MKNILDIFPVQKTRKSKRLENIKATVSKMTIVCSSPFGYFALMPQEMTYHIFSFLGIEDLSMLTITSREFKGMVNDYFSHQNIYRRYFPIEYHHDDNLAPEKQSVLLQQTADLALLKKRSTCLEGNNDRVSLIIKTMLSYMCAEKKCTNTNSCLAMSCFGKFLSVFMVGWEDVEREKVFHTIGSYSRVPKYVAPVLNGNPGKMEYMELHVRLFYRRVFLNHAATKADRIFWMENILRPLPLVHQAKMILLLFGYMEGNRVIWTDYCENAPTTKVGCLLRFSDMARCLKLMISDGALWSPDDVISVFEELICIPNDWLVENVCTLLYFCGEEIYQRLMLSKALNGRMQDVSTMLVYLSLAHTRIEQNARAVVDLFGVICSFLSQPKQKVGLLLRVLEIFREYVSDLHEYSDDEDSNREFHMMLQAQLEFSKEICLLAVEGYGFLNAPKPGSGMLAVPLKKK